MGILQDPRIQVDPGIPSATASEVERVLVSSSRAGAISRTLISGFTSVPICCSNASFS
jgi:hypothetical protein